MEPPAGPADAARRTRAMSEAVDTRRAQRRNEMDVTLGYAAAMDARLDGEIGGEDETPRATSPRANRRREIAADARGTRRLARTQSIEDQKT